MTAHRRAVEQALATPELLEIILSCLPPLDILLLQRTSQLWRDLIMRSPRLQKILFMRPDWYLEGKIYDPRRKINKPGERPRNNLMLRRVLGAYPTMSLKSVTPESDDWTVDDASQLSPNIGPTSKNADEHSSTGHWVWDVHLSVPADTVFAAAICDHTISYEHASWRKMYLSQPPATALHLRRRWQRAAQPTILQEDGITTGEFVAATSKAGDAWNQRFISSDRDWHFEGRIRFSHVEGERVVT